MKPFQNLNARDVASSLRALFVVVAVICAMAAAKTLKPTQPDAQLQTASVATTLTR